LGLPRAARPAITTTGGHEISRFSRPQTPRMQRLFDRAGSAGSSRLTLPTMLPSARTHGVGTPDCINFAALSPRLRVPLPTLRRRPRGQPTVAVGTALRPCGLGLPPAQIPACGTTALGSCLGYERRTASQARDAGYGPAGAIGS